MNHSLGNTTQQVGVNGVGQRRPRPEAAFNWGFGCPQLPGLALGHTPPQMAPFYLNGSMPGASCSLPPPPTPPPGHSATLLVPVAVDALPHALQSFAWVPAAADTSFAGTLQVAAPDLCLMPGTPVYWVPPVPSTGTVLRGANGGTGVVLGNGTFESAASFPSWAVPLSCQSQPVEHPDRAAGRILQERGSRMHATLHAKAVGSGASLSASSCSTYCTRIAEDTARDFHSDISSMSLSPELSLGGERFTNSNKLDEKSVSLGRDQRALRILRWRQKRRLQIEAFRRERERHPDRRRAVAKQRPRIGGRFLPKAVELTMRQNSSDLASAPAGTQG